MTLAGWRQRLRLGDAESGASAVEYALIVTAIAAVIVAIVVGLGLMVNKSVTQSCDHIKQTLNSNASDQCVSSGP
jgi:Flp pilus assembly pilin Flp